MSSAATRSTAFCLPETAHQRYGLPSHGSHNTFRQQIENRAAELLEKHPHFRGRRQFVQFRCTGQRLILRGFLPSFFLKQLAQEAIREIDEVEIDNKVTVLGMIGEILDPVQTQSTTDSTKSVKRIPQ